MVKKMVWPLALLLMTGADYLGQETARYSKNIGGNNFEIIFGETGLASDQQKETSDSAFRIIEETLFTLSNSNSDSAVSKINSAQAGTVIELDADALFVLKEADKIYKLTGGAVDPASGALTELWAAAKEKNQVPLREEVELALKKTGFSRFLVNPEKKNVTVLEGGALLSLDDAAIAYAVDKAAAFLKEKDVRSAVISFEKGLRLVGLSAEGRFRRIGLEHPRSVEQYAAMLDLDQDGALLTTADFQNFFMVQGKRFASPVDPRTGMPAKNDVLSVNLFAKKALTAQLLSQACFILGEAKSYELLDALKEEAAQAVFLTQNVAGPMLLSSSDVLRSNLKDIQL